MSESRLLVVVQLDPDGGAPRVVPADKPLLFADDLAALRGDGLFETLLLREGTVRNFDPHLQRFRNSARIVELPLPELDQWREATDCAIQAWENTVVETDLAGCDAAVRWNLSRGREGSGVVQAWITVAALPEHYVEDRRTGIAVLSGPRGFRMDIAERAPWALAGAKTLSYAVNMAALRYAKAHNADDMIFVDDDGFVLEGPTSTVVVAQGRRLLTPRPQDGILRGTTQQQLFVVAQQRGWEVQEQRLRIEDLVHADAVYLASSGRLLTRVRLLDGQELSESPYAEEIAALAEEAVAS